MKIKLLYLGNKLTKHGYNKTTIETLGPALKHEGYMVYYSSDKKVFFFRLFDMMKEVFNQRKQVKYVLIDTYSTKAFWYAFLCSQLARLLQLKYIPILHGGDLPNRLKKNPKICRLIFNHAYKNVAPSVYLKQAFETAGYSNIILIPNSIAIKEYPFQLRTTLEPKLLWVRAFAAIYNPKMAIDVLVTLQKKYPTTSLTMVGPDKDGSLQSTKEYALLKEVDVTFTGQLSKVDWWELASEHSIFINTTHFDNMPVSVMEAMAMGLPIVSTNVGGISYLLVDEVNALLVDDNQSKEMAEAIIQLVENPNNAMVLAHKAREDMEQMDWEEVKIQWFELLE